MLEAQVGILRNRTLKNFKYNDNATLKSWFVGNEPGKEISSFTRLKFYLCPL
jgi:hypothetical protein